MSAFREFFQPFVTRTSGYELTHIPVAATQCGVILGHQGQRIQQLQSYHDVILRLDREKGDLEFGVKNCGFCCDCRNPKPDRDV